MVLEGIKKRTKYVRYINGIGLIVHPTYVGDTFGLPIKCDGYGLIGLETKGFERIFSYERDEVIKMNKLKELDIKDVIEDLEGDVKPCIEVVKNEFKGIEASLEPKIDTIEEGVEDVVESARDLVLGTLKKATLAVRGASKETLVASGVVTVLGLVIVARKLLR